MKKAIFLVLSLFVLSVGRAEAAVNFDSYPGTVTLSEGQSRYELGWMTREYYAPTECSAGPWLKNLPVSSRGIGKKIVSRDYYWAPAKTKTVYNSFKATLTNIEGLLGSRVDYSEPAPLIVVVRCKQRSGDKLEETDSIQLSFIKKSQPVPRPVSARNLGDLEPRVSPEATASPDLTPDSGTKSAPAKKTSPAAFDGGEDSRIDPISSGVDVSTEKTSPVAFNGGEDSRRGSFKTVSDFDSGEDSRIDPVSTGVDVPTPVSKTESAPVEKKSPTASVAGETSQKSFAKTASDCVCGRTAFGECVAYPTNNKKCAGSTLVDYYYCPNKMPNEIVIEGNSDYPKKFTYDATACNASGKDRVKDCNPCGRGSDGKCIVPTHNKKCAAGILVDYYYCPNKGENSPIESDPLYAKTFNANSTSCQEQFEKEVNPTCPPCGADSSGNCVKPKRYNRCSANDEFKRAYFYACPNKSNPLDNPILDNRSYRVTYEKDSSCSRPYTPGSSSSSSTPTPKGGGTPSSGVSGSQTPSSSTPSTGNTNPTESTTPAVSTPKAFDCSTCSQCGCNSDKTACVNPVTRSRCSNNKPGYWATFQTCPGTDTPASGTKPDYTLDTVRCPTNKPTPVFRTTTKFFGSIIESISGLLLNWR